MGVLVTLSRSLVFAVVVAAGLAPCHGASSELGLTTTVTTIPRIKRPIELKDLFHPKSLRRLKKVERFVQAEPNNGLPPAHHTEAYLAHDGRDLLVFFVCSDPEYHLALKEKAENDRLEVVIDIMDGHQRSYLFTSDPLGHQEAALFDQGKFQKDLEQPWRVANKLTPDGYVLEISIPLSMFPSNLTNPNVRGIWGIRLRRWLGHSHEYVRWPPDCGEKTCSSLEQRAGQPAGGRQ